MKTKCDRCKKKIKKGSKAYLCPCCNEFVCEDCEKKEKVVNSCAKR